MGVRGLGDEGEEGGLLAGGGFGNEQGKIR